MVDCACCICAFFLVAAIWGWTIPNRLPHFPSIVFPIRFAFAAVFFHRWLGRANRTAYAARTIAKKRHRQHRRPRRRKQFCRTKLIGSILCFSTCSAHMTQTAAATRKHGSNTNLGHPFGEADSKNYAVVPHLSTANNYNKTKFGSQILATTIRIITRETNVSKHKQQCANRQDHTDRQFANRRKHKSLGTKPSGN